MNAKPHVHTLIISPPDSDGDVKIEYGDQARYVYRVYPFSIFLCAFWLQFSYRLKRRCVKIVRKHDRASQKAGKRAEQIQEIATVKLPQVRSEWAKEDIRVL